MPTNLPAEYYKYEKEYDDAKGRNEKIRCLENMIAAIPHHKGTNKLIGDLKRKISKFRKEIEADAKRRKGGRSTGIKKEGAAQVVLLGLPNSGKSFIMNKLCNMKLASTQRPFETTKPEVGMLNYKGVLIQLIEIPSITKGIYKKKGNIRNVMNTADAFCFVLKGKKDLEKIKSEIDMGKKEYVKVLSKEITKIPEIIWNVLGLIKIYTKTPGKKPEKKPIAMKKGATVAQLGNEIHKDFVENLKYARIIRRKSKIRERQGGVRFVLEDEDIVEFHLK